MKSLIYLMVFAFLAAPSAFSQSQYQRLIVFGDSLSDVGTYSKTASLMKGGKFTTNPGMIWIEIIAQSLKLPMQPNRYEGVAYPTQIVGGFNYAQGGARIKLERGEKEPEVEKLGLTGRPITTQIQYFLKQHKKFLPTDLVFIQGGANDVFSQLGQSQSGHISQEAALKNVVLAANQLNELILSIRKAGATNVVVLSLPFIQKTPLVLGMPAQSQMLVDSMVQSYNAQLAMGARTLGVRLIDLVHFEKAMNQNYSQYGFKNITQPACSLRFLPEKSALFCSPKNFMEANANSTYKFADLIHPTTGFSQLMGRYILSELSQRRR